MKPLIRLCALHCIVWASLLTGCAIPPKTNTTPDLFPNALIAERIQMRQGYVHITPPFEIASKDQWFWVELGFVRRDEVLPFRRFKCLVESRQGGMRYLARKAAPESSLKKYECPDDEPGILVRWELLNESGAVAYMREFDSLVEDNPGESGAVVTIALHKKHLFDKPTGAFRLRLTVLRDFPELDVTTPYVLVQTPLIRRR